jgi:hypothetical protein
MPVQFKGTSFSTYEYFNTLLLSHTDGKITNFQTEGQLAYPHNKFSHLDL